MAIKNKREGGYTTVNNAALLDSRLSLKAKGLLTIMLSRPDDWVYHMSWVEKQSRDGRDATRNAMKELIDAGYIIRQTAHNESGHFDGWDYLVCDTPSDGKTVRRENRPTGKPSDGKPATTNTDSTKTDLTKTETSLALANVVVEAELVDASPQKRKEVPAELQRFYATWNEHCGALPKSSNNKEVTKMLKAELKNRTPDELDYAIARGAQVVAKESWWQEKGFGLISLLRNLDSKVEKYEHRGDLSGANAVAYSRAQNLLNLRLGDER